MQDNTDVTYQNNNTQPSNENMSNEEKNAILENINNKYNEELEEIYLDFEEEIEIMKDQVKKGENPHPIPPEQLPRHQKNE